MLAVAVCLGPSPAVCLMVTWGQMVFHPDVLMPDNPVCKWSLFFGKTWPVTQLCPLVLVLQPGHSSDSAMLAVWGVERLEKVLVLGSDQGRNALQDDLGTWASRGRFHHKTTSKYLAQCRVALVLIAPDALSLRTGVSHSCLEHTYSKAHGFSHCLQLFHSKGS